MTCWTCESRAVCRAARREPGDRRVERVRRIPRGDLDQRHADRADPIRDHLPGERLVGEPAGRRGRPVAVVVRRVVRERAERPVLRLPEVPEREALGVVHPRAPHGEPARAGAQQEPLLDLRVAGPELVDGHVRMVGAPVRVLGDDRERAGGCDIRNGDVADLVRHWSRNALVGSRYGWLAHAPQGASGAPEASQWSPTTTGVSGATRATGRGFAP